MELYNLVVEFIFGATPPAVFYLVEPFFFVMFMFPMFVIIYYPIIIVVILTHYTLFGMFKKVRRR